MNVYRLRFVSHGRVIRIIFTFVVVLMLTLGILCVPRLGARLAGGNGARTACLGRFNQSLVCEVVKSSLRITDRDYLRDVCFQQDATCAIPQRADYGSPLHLYSVKELRSALGPASGGGASCVAGPMHAGDLTHESRTVVRGSPRWSVFRRTCATTYRDFNPSEVLSILFHYLSGVANHRKVRGGLLIRGDSMLRNVAFRFIAFLRASPHVLNLRETEVLHMLFEDHDELVFLTDLADQSTTSAARARCVLMHLFPGYISMEKWSHAARDPTGQCLELMRGLLLTMLFIRQSYPETMVMKQAFYPTASPLSFQAPMYWWNRSVEQNWTATGPSSPSAMKSVLHLTQLFLDMEEDRNCHGALATSYDRVSPFPFLSFVATAPRWLPTVRLDVVNRIPMDLLVARNAYLRQQGWDGPSRHAEGHSDPANHTVSPRICPGLMRRYLLDFDALAEHMKEIIPRVDGIHYTCHEKAIGMTGTFFCADAMNVILIQWVSHIVAEELLAWTI